MTEDYMNHDPPPGTGHTRGDVKAVAAGLRQRLADFTARIERMAAAWFLPVSRWLTRFNRVA